MVLNIFQILDQTGAVFQTVSLIQLFHSFTRVYIAIIAETAFGISQPAAINNNTPCTI